MLKSVLAVAVASLLFGSTAVAQNPVRACVTDIKKLCEGVQPGEGRIAGCVKEHFQDLSTPCQNFLAATAAAATSSMLTRLRAGAFAFALSSKASNSGIPDAARVASGPGEIACTRMPFGPSSAAR